MNHHLIVETSFHPGRILFGRSQDCEGVDGEEKVCTHIYDARHSARLFQDQ